MNTKVRILHLLCEGQTEETVARDVLAPYFEQFDVYTRVSILATKRPAGGRAFRGGVTSWQKLRNELNRLLADPTMTVLTTMLDYYAIPSDTPGMATRPNGTPYDRVAHVESELGAAIADSRFVPGLVLHEIETWAMVGSRSLGDLAGDARVAEKVNRIVVEAGGAEFVDDGPATAPSKRILSIWPDYRKTSDGPLAISDVGIAAIREACPHADAWFSSLESALRPA